jgi:hypothetical protein
MRNAGCGLRNLRFAFVCPMKYQTLGPIITGQAATVKLNRAEVFNVFNEATIAELEYCISLTPIRPDRGLPIPQSAFRIPHFSPP